MPPKDTFPQKIKRLTETYFLNDGHEKYASFEAKKSVSDQQIRLGEKMVWGGLALVVTGSSGWQDATWISFLLAAVVMGFGLYLQLQGTRILDEIHSQRLKR